jgi:hypothetical protein
LGAAAAGTSAQLLGDAAGLADRALDQRAPVLLLGTIPPATEK